MFEKRWLVEEWFEGPDFVDDVESWRFRWEDDALEFVLERAREAILSTTYDWSREREEWMEAWRCRLSNTKTERSRVYDWLSVPLPKQLSARYAHLVPWELRD